MVYVAHTTYDVDGCNSFNAYVFYWCQCPYFYSGHRCFGRNDGRSAVQTEDPLVSLSFHGGLVTHLMILHPEQQVVLILGPGAGATMDTPEGD